jgi:hypothetical protein
MFVMEKTDFLPSVVPFHKLVQEMSKNIKKNRDIKLRNKVYNGIH